MGNCKYCGKPAGLFRQKHIDCESARSAALSRVVETVERAATGRIGSPAVQEAVARAGALYANPTDIRMAIIKGWADAVEHALEDGILESTEEEQLVALQDAHGLTQEELETHGAYSRVVKAAVLRELLNGMIPSKIHVEGVLPFNFQKSEQLIWVFPSVEYLEDKTRREYVGRSQGVSIRIAKGVYYRTGAFRGHPVERTESVSFGRGILAITNKHLYFAGPGKSFRVRHDKIVSHVPYSDGVGIVRDAATAKPQTFITGDGWFTYNLMSNVAQL